jgi:hypothetical protein
LPKRSQKPDRRWLVYPVIANWFSTMGIEIIQNKSIRTLL